MKKFKVGYTQGVYDMFHVGHLNLINNAKLYCDYLIVGINSDKLVQEYKNKTPVINENDRKRIVENIKSVDEVVIVDTLDKVEILSQIHYDAIFIGDDWKGNRRWMQTEIDLKKFLVEVVYLPHTDGVSSTALKPRTRVEE